MLNATLFSYIDPVSGVILLQLVIGGCIGGCAFLWGKIGGGFKALNPFSKAKSNAGEQQEVEEA